jgi:hypothetical protein
MSATDKTDGVSAHPVERSAETQPGGKEATEGSKTDAAADAAPPPPDSDYPVRPLPRPLRWLALNPYGVYRSRSMPARSALAPTTTRVRSPLVRRGGPAQIRLLRSHIR